jgi:Protein of unknown function (DUF3631)/Domain of unknown function (DUF4326)
VRGHLTDLEKAVPELPVEDRAADTWEPLIAIAELAGDEWPERARKACLALSGEEPDDGRISTKLLADLQEVWGDGEEELFTATILNRLHKLEESPWSEWGRRSEPITARVLADLLRPYRVKSTNIRISGDQAKGYYQKDLVDAWRRYVPKPSQESQRPNDGETPNQPRDGNGTDDASHNRPTPDANKQAHWGRRDGRDELCAEIRSALHGRDLACWCPLDQPCHADVLLEIANPSMSDWLGHLAAGA